MRAKPYFVKKVTSTTSDFSYEAKPQTKRAFDKDVTADVTDAMTYTVKPGGTATKLAARSTVRSPARPARSEEKSIWFSGFVPQLAVSIGMYKPDAQRQPADHDRARGHHPHRLARSRPTSSTTS